MELRINKAYILFIGLVGTCTSTFIGWVITSQVYAQWSHGLPIVGGWNWPSVIGLDLVCLWAILALYWKLYADAKTTIDATGITRPSLQGLKTIRWPEVTQITVFGSVGYHVYAGAQKIVVSPYTYCDSECVIKVLQHYTSKHKCSI